jgi:CRP/FNR family transcriptional regulator
MTLDELDAARNWMLILGRKTAREKIASLIAILAKRESNMGHRPVATPIELELPLTREAMADYLGLTLETVSRQMSALKAEGIIELASARRVKVPNLARLTLAAGDEP